MFRFAEDVPVYLHREPIDFRAGIGTLAVRVEQAMPVSPFTRAIFAFCNRRRTSVKLLLWDRSGFVLILKRLEASDKFFWPGKGQAVLEVTSEQLKWLLDGIDIAAVQRHPQRSYAAMG
jgi:transposase